MTDEWQVRPATEGDLDALVDFNCAMAMETEKRQLDVSRVRQGLRRILDTPELGRALVVTDQAGNLAGAMALTSEWSDWRNGRFWWIQSVYVVPRFRRRGVFSALYDHVEAEARRDPEVCGLRLYVEKENHNAQATYRSLGMNETHYRLYEVDFDGTA